MSTKPLQIVVNLLLVCERQVAAVLFASSRNRLVDFIRLAASCSLWQACYCQFSTKLQSVDSLRQPGKFINLQQVCDISGRVVDTYSALLLFLC